MLRQVLAIAHSAAAMLAVLLLVACSERSSGPTATDAHNPGMTADTHGVTVADPRSRPTPPLATVGVAYMSITNHGLTTDRLLGASSPAAARVELHANSTEGGVTRMRPLGALELAPHETASIDPGGMHFMLTDLAAPLVTGAHFPLTLKFEAAGEITVDVVVQEGADKAHDAHEHGHQQ